MDDIVRQAIAKWPRVPHCYGWLGLDARGNWYLRDEQAQALGPFAGGAPGSRGALLRHENLIAFIGRNYEADAMGQWFFQNGPQRVYVELEATPWVWRVGEGFALQSHTGLLTEAVGSVIDEAGHLYLESPSGLGIVHSQDVLQASEAVEAGLWRPEAIESRALPVRFGFVRSPQSAQGAGPSAAP
jgi:hypothetical protein